MARPGGDHARDDIRASSIEHPGVVLHLAKGDHAGPFPSPAHRPPAFWSSFIGRGQDVEELAALLGSARLVTLTGPGGMGKTRLAVEVAERVAPGRAFFVDLAPVHDPSLVAEEIANAFAVGELRGRDLADVLAGELPAGAFLVLDNCEHLIGACAEIVHRLLARCRGLQILATSQQRLGVTGEALWRVPALATPEPAPEVTPEVALRSAAVQLFCDRAQALSRDFTTSPANLAAIVEICWRLDGNPLAIELAAACTDVLSPTDIAARLADRFGLLRRGDSAGPARHQTLAAALRWSDELLSEAERTLLRRLSVFAGGFSLRAAEEVCAGPPVGPEEVLALLSGLVAKSLVAAETGGAVTRYRLLETVRHYAADGLTASGEAPALRERHAVWCLEVADRGGSVADTPAAGGEETGPDNLHDNTRAALEWCLEQQRTELALRLAAAQMKRWEDSGRFAEAREWLERVVTASGSAPAALRATALHDAGFASFMLGDFDAAHRYIGQSLELWAESGDVAGAERTRGLWTFISNFSRGPTSVEDVEADLERARAGDDDARLAEALVGCAHARLFRGEPAAAQRHFEELASVARRSGEDSMTATALVGLGITALLQGAYGSAADALEDGTALAAAVGETHTEAGGRTWLAELTRRRGDQARARAEFEECLRQSRSLGAPYPLASSLLGLARVVLDQGDAVEAAPLFEEAAGVAAQAGGLTHLVAAAVDGLGQVAMAQGDVVAAQARFEEALSLAGQSADQVGVIRSTYHLGEVASAGDDLTRAVSLHNEALQKRHEVGDRAGVADSLDALAGLAVARENPQVACRVFGAADALRQAGGFPRGLRRERAYEADVAALRAQIPADELEQAWAQGATMSANEAVAYVLRGRGSRIRPPKGPDSLTRAEREIVDFVCEGLTNPEIAARLFISPRTVQSHLRKAYARLGVKSRGQLRQVMAKWRTPT